MMYFILGLVVMYLLVGLFCAIQAIRHDKAFGDVFDISDGIILLILVVSWPWFLHWVVGDIIEDLKP